MDTFGPITDNAGGIVEMSQQPEEIRKKTDRLDSVGNTTKALTKGYAIGSAALAAFLLFSAYLDEVKNYGAQLSSVNIAKPEVFVGGLLGAMLVFFFSRPRDQGRRQGGRRSSSRKCARSSARTRASWRAPRSPTTAACVDIVTRGALQADDRCRASSRSASRSSVGVRSSSTFGGRRRGGGGAADGRHDRRHPDGHVPEQRRRRLGQREEVHRDGQFKVDGKVLGKSDAHKAAVVGDTVGDPFKDTAGPSLHVLIKLLATITLVLAPLFI